jgi:hypothetical protein
MLKQVKRTSGAIKQRRRGLDHKIQDLFARIHIGGRTDLWNHRNTGTLNKKGLGWAVDHQSNGRGGGGSRYEPGSWVHGGPGQGVSPWSDQDRPRAIARPWTWACDARWQARWDREGTMARGDASPVQPQEGVPGGQYEHRRVLRVAREHASMPRESGGGAGVYGGQRRRGAGRVTPQFFN